MKPDLPDIDQWSPPTGRLMFPDIPEDDPETGGVTAEYAIAILTAAGFAGLLLAILQSETVRAWLLAIVERALG
jgi:hypothetical protein